MPSNPPFPVAPAAPEQRLLAAVVFTDASGYSARAELEEARAVELIEQDFVVMRECSKELSGTVLKSTGDGLLIYFTSAVHAVTWALRTQRIFAARARGPGTENFRHRVGIHVGDVFLKENDVMGDGVNVAARLQAEAPPGGICISQTVFEVVKNKMELHVIRLEPRKLKNIREPMQLYHLLLEEPQRPSYAPTATATAPGGAKPAASAKKSRWLLGATLTLAALAGGIALMWRMDSEHERELSRSQAAQAALGAALANPKAHATPAAATATPTAAAPEFDFAKMTTAQPATTAAGRAFAEAQDAAAKMELWLVPQLQRYTRERPLVVRDLRGALQDTTVYGDPDGRLCFVEGRATRKREWSTLAPELQGTIVVGALRAAPDRTALRGAEAFAYLHGLPELAAALQRERTAATLFSK